MMGRHKHQSIMDPRKLPFNALIVGPTNSGKTQYLLNQLRGPFRGKFDYIVLLCPTFVKNKTYKGFVDRDPNIFVIVCLQHEIEDWLRVASYFFSGTNTLFILDDCAASKDVKGRTGQLVNLGFSARHDGISVWVLTQQITSIAKPYRDNIAAIVLFYTPSSKTTKAIFEDYAGEITHEEYKEFIAKLKKHKFSHLVFALRLRPKFDVTLPNAVHQADLLFLPHDKLPRGKKVYKYALTVVDVASRYKAAEAITSKESDEVARGFAKIYRHGPMKWPQMLQVDPGREFMGAVTKTMSEHNVTIRRGRTNIHRDQAIVERFNRTLAEKLFGFQYAVEMNMPSGRSTAWVKRLPEVVSALNNEVTRLIGKKPAVAIREKIVSFKPATTYMRPVGENERKLPLYAHVRYLYYPGELEGGGRRATDPIWSLKVFKIQKVVTKPETPVVYYLLDGPKRGFVREELMVVPLGTVLPPPTVR